MQSIYIRTRAFSYRESRELAFRCIEYSLRAAIRADLKRINAYTYGGQWVSRARIIRMAITSASLLLLPLLPNSYVVTSNTVHCHGSFFRLAFAQCHEVSWTHIFLQTLRLEDDASLCLVRNVLKY